MRMQRDEWKTDRRTKEENKRKGGGTEEVEEEECGESEEEVDKVDAITVEKKLLKKVIK